MNRDFSNVECLRIQEGPRDREVFSHVVLVREWQQEVLFSSYSDVWHHQVTQPRHVGGLVHLHDDRLLPQR